MGACCGHEEEEAPNALVLNAALLEEPDINRLPSRLGLLGVWKIDMTASPGRESARIEINDAVVSYRGLNCPVDACLRELREEEEGNWTVYMSCTFYCPENSPDWHNGPPLLVNIQMSNKCTWEASVNGWMNSSSTVNVIYQLDEDAPFSTTASRNGYSDKIKQLHEAEKYRTKSGGDSPHYIYGGGAQSEECPLCFENFDEDQHMPMVTKCKHVWCSGCIVAVCQLSPPNNTGECPACRASVALAEIRRR